MVTWVLSLSPSLNRKISIDTLILANQKIINTRSFGIDPDRYVFERTVQDRAKRPVPASSLDIFGLDWHGESLRMLALLVSRAINLDITPAAALRKNQRRHYDRLNISWKFRYWWQMIGLTIVRSLFKPEHDATIVETVRSHLHPQKLAFCQSYALGTLCPFLYVRDVQMTWFQR